MPKNWVMAPLEHNPRQEFNRVWEYDRQNGVISIGWSMGGFKSPEELQRKYARNAGIEGWGKRGLSMLKKFWYEIKPGDRIIARAGRSQIVDVGEVTGAPFYDPQKGVEQGGPFGVFHQYFLPVQWRGIGVVFPVLEFSMLTLYDVTDDRFEKLVSQCSNQLPDSSESPTTDGVPNKREVNSPWSPVNIDALAAQLLWEPAQLREIIDDLQEKGQVIFYGPPGTGKTYVAREIAKQCQLDGGDFEIVQFHPSYSYEDFVEGFRPRLIGGQAGFELVPGPLRRIADKARANPEATFVLVIDELNRGNVAKVFGELYFLLEYRDEEVRLQYGGDGGGFSLPRNLWFICTMNTADRSIALMDAALRRRFYFAPFFPDQPPVKGLLRRWLTSKGQDTLTADLVDAANERLDKETGIGPSYFMVEDSLDDARLRRIWNRAVIPYVEEQCFGDAEKLAGFGFDRLKRQLNGPAPSGGWLDNDTEPELVADDADANAA